MNIFNVFPVYVTEWGAVCIGLF